MTSATSPVLPNQQAKSKARYIRIAPRKVRLVVDAIRGKTVAEAEILLQFIPKGAAVPVGKVLRSAKANAVNNHDMLEDQLVVKTAFVDEGPSLKRILPRARGRGDYMAKRTSHITIILEEADLKTAGRRRRGSAPRGQQASGQQGGTRGQ